MGVISIVNEMLAHLLFLSQDVANGSIASINRTHDRIHPILNTQLQYGIR